MGCLHPDLAAGSVAEGPGQLFSGHLQGVGYGTPLTVGEVIREPESVWRGSARLRSAPHTGVALSLDLAATGYAVTG